VRAVSRKSEQFVVLSPIAVASSQAHLWLVCWMAGEVVNFTRSRMPPVQAIAGRARREEARGQRDQSIGVREVVASFGQGRFSLPWISAW